MSQSGDDLRALNELANAISAESAAENRIDDGGPAFPTYGSATQIPGMSVLAHFAGQALANSAICHSELSSDSIPFVACQTAIGMLKELERITSDQR